MLLSRLSFSFSETSILCIKNLLVVFEIRITVEPGVIMIRIVKNVIAQSFLNSFHMLITLIHMSRFK